MIQSLTALTLSQIDCASSLRRAPNPHIVGAGLLSSRLRRMATFQLLAAASTPSDGSGTLLNWIESRLPPKSAIAGYRLRDEILPALAALPGGSAGRIDDMVGNRQLVDLTCLRPDRTEATFREACTASEIASHGRDPFQSFNDWIFGRTGSVVEEVQVNAVATWRLAIDMIQERGGADLNMANVAPRYLQAWLSLTNLPALDVHLRFQDEASDDPF